MKHHKPKGPKKAHKPKAPKHMKPKAPKAPKHHKNMHKVHKMSKGKGKMDIVMHEFKEGELHSGSKKGPKVTNPKQAIAIGLSEARKAGAKVPRRKGSRDTHWETY